MAEAEESGAAGRGIVGEKPAPLDAADAYARYADVVYRYLLSLTHSDDLAQELTQETFYQAVRSVDRFDGSCRVTTWLCAIAKRALLAYRRKHPDHVAFEEALVDGAAREPAGGADPAAGILPAASPEEACIQRESYLRALKLLHGFVTWEYATEQGAQALTVTEREADARCGVPVKQAAASASGVQALLDALGLGGTAG